MQAGAGVVYETIRGKILKKRSPGVSMNHQRIQSNLHGELYAILKNSSCQLFGPPFDVILPIENETKGTATTVVQPDLCVVCNLGILEERGCFGPPELIVEIVSPKGEGKKEM